MGEVNFNMLIKINTLVILFLDYVKEQANIFIVKAQSLKVYGKKIKKYKENWFYSMEIFLEVFSVII
jgi:hypothetical protein